VASHGIAVVPLHVVLGGQEYSEGVDFTTPELAAALRKFTKVSTSRPSPQAFLDAYEAAAAGGADAVVSVHISSDMSGTVGSAMLAASQSPIPVEVVDSRSVGMAMGYAVLSAAVAAQRGQDAKTVAAIATARARASTVIFYVATLEHLRRGGRIGAASAPWPPWSICAAAVGSERPRPCSAQRWPSSPYWRCPTGTSIRSRRCARRLAH